MSDVNVNIFLGDVEEEDTVFVEEVRIELTDDPYLVDVKLYLADSDEDASDYGWVEKILPIDTTIESIFADYESDPDSWADSDYGE